MSIAWECGLANCGSAVTHMKLLRVDYKNADRILHYIPRNVSVLLHQVAYFVRTFNVLNRNSVYDCFICLC